MLPEGVAINLGLESIATLASFTINHAVALSHDHLVRHENNGAANSRKSLEKSRGSIPSRILFIFEPSAPHNVIAARSCSYVTTG